jgi:hypothetical protein
VSLHSSRRGIFRNRADDGFLFRFRGSDFASFFLYCFAPDSSDLTFSQCGLLAAFNPALCGGSRTRCREFNLAPTDSDLGHDFQVGAVFLVTKAD